MRKKIRNSQFYKEKNLKIFEIKVTNLQKKKPHRYSEVVILINELVPCHKKCPGKMFLENGGNPAGTHKNQK